MAIPNVNINVLDGGLGIQSPSNGDVLCFIGCSDSGTLNTPIQYTRVKDLQTAFGGGPLVEAAAYAIETVGKPVLCARMNATTQGGYGTIVTTRWAGTSVVTVDSATHPNDEYEMLLKIVTGGTIGTAGITFQYSLDGGRTMSPVTALGTANTFAIPNSGSATFKFAAGTAVAGDVVTCSTTAPAWGSSDLTTTLGALALTTQSFDTIVLVGTASAADVATLDTWCASRFAAGKFYDFVCNNVGPTSSQTDAQWQTAQQAAFASTSTTYGGVVAGYSLTRSSVVSERRYRRPALWSLAALYSRLYLGQDAAELDLGPLRGVQISDDNGNPLEHDEAIYPGMDSARFATLRTVTGYQGAYPTNPRMLAPAGSDFIYRQFRRVMNVACAVTLQTLMRRLSKAVRVNPKTGFIREEDARDIEALVNAALRTALLSKPSASAAQFVLSRTDNILSTSTLTGDVRIVPLGYTKQINVTMAFNNPAIRTA